MATAEPRPRTIGSKVTESEYAALEALAKSRNQTLSECCREVMLAQLNPTRPTPAEETIMAEIIGLRMLLLNTVYSLANGQKLTQAEMQALIQKVDGEKQAMARERLREARSDGDWVQETKPAQCLK